MPIPKESALTPDEIMAIHEAPSDHLSMLTSQREAMRCMEAGGVHTIGHGCTPALCTRWGWALGDGQLVRWPREEE